MKTLYLDIFSGISGDMFIGAMLDLGVSLETLERELEKLGLHEYHLHAARQSKCAIEGVKFDVHLAHDHDHEHDHDHDHDHHHHEGEDGHSHSHSHTHGHDHGHSHGHDHAHEGHTHEEQHRHEHGAHSHTHTHDHHHDHEHQHAHDHEHGRGFREIRELIVKSRLSSWVKEKSVAVFERIARAEGKIHGMPVEDVHFHEVGAVDSIVDVVGACICLELLGKPRVQAAPVVDGFGWIDCAHGRFPIPAPATLEIFSQRGIPVSQTDEPQELITPTGAAILVEFVEHFAPMQSLTIERIGFGLGTRDNKTRPNVLRAVLGTGEHARSSASLDWEVDNIALLEANLDDINAEILGHFVEKAFASGALDVFHTPIQMKKNRPGVLLSVLCGANDADKFAELILRETTSFGVRLSLHERRKLKREFMRVKTSHGMVDVKIGLLNGKRIQVAPEFESCRAIAEASGQPVKTIYEAALRAIED